MEWAPVEGVRGGTERRPLAGERHGTVTWTIGHCALTSVPSAALVDNLPLFEAETVAEEMFGVRPSLLYNFTKIRPRTIRTAQIEHVRHHVRCERVDFWPRRVLR